MKIRLQTRFILGIVGLTVILVVSLSLVSIHQSGALMEKTHSSNTEAVEAAMLGQMEDRGRDISLLVAETLVNPLYNTHIETIADVMRSVRQQDGTVYAYLFDAEGRVLHDGTDTLSSYGKTMADLLGHTPQDISLWREGDVQHAYVPIHIGSKTLGGVAVGLSLDGVRKDTAHIHDLMNDIQKKGQLDFLRSAGGAALVLAILSAIGAILIARNLTRPIHALVEVTKRIGGGETRVDIPFQRSDEIGELGTAVNQMADNLHLSSAQLRETLAELEKTVHQLSESNKELERFAYVASHDLQEPLRMIVSYTQLLQRRHQGELGAEADEFIGFIVEGGQRMSALIKDLLTYSRLQRSTRKSQAIDTNEVVNIALESLTALAEETQARVSFADLPPVSGDKTQLVQLFQNLLGNAMKFHVPGKAPEIGIEVKRDRGMWEFAVKDNGIGIAPHHGDRIFTMFQRLNKREDYNGTGIGLAICRRIVDNQGGSIWVDSRPGKGATFFFTLPMAVRAKNGA